MIKNLSTLISDKIKSQQYVHSTYTIVKELLENSIDANSSTIKICIDTRPLSIRVEDDGCGIDEMNLVGERGCTSKDVTTYQVVNGMCVDVSMKGSIDRLDGGMDRSIDRSKDRNKNRLDGGMDWNKNRLNGGMDGNKYGVTTTNKFNETRSNVNEVITYYNNIHNTNYNNNIHNTNYNNIHNTNNTNTSKGYRGMALNTIKNTCTLLIKSKHKNNKTAYQKLNDNITKCAREQGTTVIVTDLFNNCPIRRKINDKNVNKDIQNIIELVDGYSVVCLCYIDVVFNNQLVYSNRDIINKICGGVSSISGVRSVNGRYSVNGVSGFYSVDNSKECFNGLKNGKEYFNGVDNSEDGSNGVKNEKDDGECLNEVKNIKEFGVFDESCLKDTNTQNNNTEKVNDNINTNTYILSTTSPYNNTTSPYADNIQNYINTFHPSIHKHYTPLYNMYISLQSYKKDKSKIYHKSRLVKSKRLSKLIKSVFNLYKQGYPFFIIDIKCQVDFNLSPDKTEIIFFNENEMFKDIQSVVNNVMSRCIVIGGGCVSSVGRSNGGGYNISGDSNRSVRNGSNISNVNSVSSVSNVSGGSSINNISNGDCKVHYENTNIQSNNINSSFTDYDIDSSYISSSVNLSSPIFKRFKGNKILIGKECEDKLNDSEDKLNDSEGDSCNIKGDVIGFKDQSKCENIKLTDINKECLKDQIKKEETSIQEEISMQDYLSNSIYESDNLYLESSIDRDVTIEKDIFIDRNVTIEKDTYDEETINNGDTLYEDTYNRDTLYEDTFIEETINIEDRHNQDTYNRDTYNRDTYDEETFIDRDPSKPYNPITNTSYISNTSTLYDPHLIKINNCFIKKQPTFNLPLRIDKNDFLRMKVVGQFNKGFILCTLCKEIELILSEDIKGVGLDEEENIDDYNINLQDLSSQCIDTNYNINDSLYSDNISSQCIDTNYNSNDSLYSDNRNLETALHTDIIHSQDLSSQCIDTNYNTPNNNNNNIFTTTTNITNTNTPNNISNTTKNIISTKNPITTTTKTYLIIIDQHAADEIFNYTQILLKTPIRKQKLVVPKHLNVSTLDLMFINDNKDIFNKYGFVIKDDCLVTTPMFKDKQFGMEEFYELLGNIKNSDLYINNNSSCDNNLVGDIIYETGISIKDIDDNTGTSNKGIDDDNSISYRGIDVINDSSTKETSTNEADLNNNCKENLIIGNSNDSSTKEDGTNTIYETNNIYTNNTFLCIDKIHEIVSSKACRSSVMVGDSLSYKRMEEIVRNLGFTERPWACPHGRPTFTVIGEV